MATREECIEITKKTYPNDAEYMADYYYKHTGSWENVLDVVKKEYERNKNNLPICE